MADEASRLISAMARGDRAALGGLYRLTSARIFGILVYILRHDADAEDALQNVYEKAWRNAPRFQPERAGIPWLVSIARNHAIDVIRARRRRDPADVEVDELMDLSLGTAERTVLRRDLGRCLDALGQDQAAIILDVYLEGLSYEEVAAKAGAPVNTIRTWLRRGLLKLRDCLGGDDAS